MNEFERRKLEVGMAPYGSREYLLNATYVLSSNTHHPEGREKLKALATSSDATVADYARRCLEDD